MRLKGKAKQVWWSFRNIQDSKNIPEELEGIAAIDSNEDDDYIFYIIEYVKKIKEIFLVDTYITNEAVKYIANVKGLKKLTLAKHQTITSEALPYINKLVELEYLDISKTKIELADISLLKNLGNLKELHLSTNEEDENLISEKVKELKNQFTDCIFFINYTEFV